MSTEKLRHDIARVVLAAIADEASVEELAMLNETISARPELVPFVVDLMSQESWLAWHSTKSSNSEIRSDLLDQITKSILSASGEPLRAENEAAPTAESTAVVGCSTTVHRSTGWLTALAASLLVTVGALVGITVDRWGMLGRPNPSTVVITDRSPDQFGSGQLAVRYVGGTSCLWNSEMIRTPEADHEVRTGESLNLLQGIAELMFDLPDGSALLKIEGPAGLVITQEHSASLNQGTFIAETRTERSDFRLQSPNGLIDIAENSAVGLRIAGSDVEVHVFEGRAQIVIPWAAGPEDSKIIDVAEGASVSLTSSSDGRIRIDRGVASASSFAAKLSMDADNLVIPDAYSREVLKARPLLYWRFEDGNSGRVVDLSGNELHGSVIGTVDWVNAAGNRSLALGDGITEDAIGSYVRSDRPVSDELSDEYSLELWFKPSHSHWGSLVSILDCRPGSPTYAGHGVALELGGARSNSSVLERPARIRFLHRDPPGADITIGKSCYSKSPYTVRHWQHLVGVKRAEELSLYVDGELVGVEAEKSSLAPGLSMLVGQLDEKQFYRRFVGQLDELAIYARPLSEAEIVEHYRIARPTIRQGSAARGRQSEPIGVGKAADPI